MIAFAILLLIFLLTSAFRVGYVVGLRSAPVSLVTVEEPPVPLVPCGSMEMQRPIVFSMVGDVQDTDVDIDSDDTSSMF